MDLKDLIAKNISALRKHNKMTQLELAEKLNYSDKTVSRWESGDITPDIKTLSRLANIFGVSLTSILEENLDIEKSEKEDRQKKINKLIIALLVITFIWTMATIIYVYSMLIDGGYWQIFIYAFPATFLVASIFNKIWGRRRNTYILVSALIWTTILSIHIAALPYNVWAIYILGAPLQIVIVLWSKLHS